MGSVWYVLGLICLNKLETLYLHTEFEASIEMRRGHDMLEGIEFHLAEIAS